MLPIIFGALVIGVCLGLLGSGGSIITVPSLIYLVGQEEKVAIAGSLAIVGAVSLAGAIPYARRREVDWPSVVVFGIPGMLGTYCGAYLSQFVTGETQLVIFECVMLLVAVIMLRSPKGDEIASAEPRARRPVPKIALDGLLVGTLTGLVGVGGGFLIIPALVILGGLPMRTAVGTSLLIIALKSASGFGKYVGVLEESGLSLDWQVLGIFIAIGIAGTLLGQRISRSISQAALRRGFGVSLVVLSVWMLARSALS